VIPNLQLGDHLISSGILDVHCADSDTYAKAEFGNYPGFCQRSAKRLFIRQLHPEGWLLILTK
jgi:hypothetical protein